jgi:cytochrome c-type biogenesis protein CcmF
LVVFAGLATLAELYKGSAARRKAHGEPWLLALRRLFARNQRRYGGYTIHLGVVVIGLGIIGSTAFQEVRQVTLAPGETLQIGPYTMLYEQASENRAVDGRYMFIADVSLWKNERNVASLRPRRDVFEGGSTPMTIAGLHSTLENDVYVLLTFWDADRVTFRVYRNPLVNFVWWGGLLLMLGTFIAVYPHPEKSVAPVSATARLQTRPVGAGD